MPDFQKAGSPIFKNSGCRLTGRVAQWRWPRAFQTVHHRINLKIKFHFSYTIFRKISFQKFFKSSFFNFFTTYNKNKIKLFSSSLICTKTKSATYYTEVCFASFLSGGFITAILSLPESILAKHTSVHCLIKWFQIYQNKTFDHHTAGQSFCPPIIPLHYIEDCRNLLQ